MIAHTNPLVSILVPVYGVEKYIERCVETLMEQTYNNIEYIFVNDCTKDASIEILKKTIDRYPSRKDRVLILNHEKNRGLAAARNSAFDASRGDYLWHVDSDDWVMLDAVEKLVNSIQTEDGTDVIIFGNYNVRLGSMTRDSINYRGKHSYISNILLHTIAGSVWNKFFRADFYRESGVRSIDGLNHGEDYAIIPRLLHKARIINVLDEPLYFYNLTNQNSYTQNISAISISNVHQAYQINLDYFSSVDNKEQYDITLKLLPFRSMLALIKKASRDRYQDIVQMYPECFLNHSVGLSRMDMFILFLIKQKQYYLLSLIIQFYKRLSR